ncbi:MAG: hypothetical protein JO280_01185 [Mycobacteriaceae bacterium]|nr:hypothetical protein [Mycobacteriaceae bacterium]
MTIAVINFISCLLAGADHARCRPSNASEIVSGFGDCAGHLVAESVPAPDHVATHHVERPGVINISSFTRVGPDTYSTVDPVQDNAEWLFHLKRCNVSLM